MRIDAECASLRSEIGWAELGYFVCHSKWLLPESLVFLPIKGNEDSANEIVRGLVAWRQQFMKRVTWVRHNLIKKGFTQHLSLDISTNYCDTVTGVGKKSEQMS